MRCERHRYIFYGILKLEVTFNIYTASIYGWIHSHKQPDFKEMLLLNPHHFINMCKWKDTPTIKSFKLYRGLPLMSGLFPWYTPQKVNNVFTGWSLLEMYLYIWFMLCMLSSANSPMWRPMWGYIPSSIWYLLYSIIVSTRLMFYESNLGLCVFMKLCLVYAISRKWPYKKCFTITHRWEQTQQMCEMRKEIYFSPISMRWWPSPHESCS